MKTFLFRMYSSFRQNFWYLFPGSVFRFFAQEREEQKLYLATLTEREKEEIKKQKRRNLFSFSASFLLHCLFCFSFFYNFMNPILIEKDRIIAGDTIDFDVMDGMLSSDVDPVYDKKSEFIIKPSTLIREEKKDQSLTSLLKQLKKTKISSLSGKTFKKRKEYKSNLVQEEHKLKASMGWKKTKREVTPLKVQLWDHMKMFKTDKTKKTAANQEDTEIMKVIDQHSFQFQECYEKALLLDEKLSGKVIFLLKLNHSKVEKSGMELEGQGSSNSRRKLTHCLFQESKKLVFLKNKKNISVKFNLIFGL